MAAACKAQFAFQPQLQLMRAELPRCIATSDFQQPGQHQSDAYPACRNQQAGTAAMADVIQKNNIKAN